jgi:hypothetical protein
MPDRKLGLPPGGAFGRGAFVVCQRSVGDPQHIAAQARRRDRPGSRRLKHRTRIRGEPMRALLLSSGGQVASAGFSPPAAAPQYPRTGPAIPPHEPAGGPAAAHRTFPQLRVVAPPLRPSAPDENHPAQTLKRVCSWWFSSGGRGFVVRAVGGGLGGAVGAGVWAGWPCGLVPAVGRCVGVPASRCVGASVRRCVGVPVGRWVHGFDGLWK